MDFLGKNHKNVLDVGFGDGVLLKELSERGKKVYGIDIHGANKMVMEMCKKEGIAKKVELKEAGVTKIPYKDNFFDAVVCVSVLEHVKDTNKARKELFRVIKPNGKLVVGLPMEGFLTKLAWKIFLRSDFNHHVQTHQSIIENFKKSFSITNLKYFPLKSSIFGLYTIICFEKNNSV